MSIANRIIQCRQMRRFTRESTVKLAGRHYVESTPEVSTHAMLRVPPRSQHSDQPVSISYKFGGAQ